MNPAEMKTALIAEARTLGFDVCRVAEAFVDRFRETVQRRVGLVLQRLSA